ncbi:uncharacterized protein LOC119328168 [Triticum dicoccoides]|uniref:uncharacterized protein LOC119328168 n=1 Tax=Triticum dicoccoides TaxID=85692 RepID=UPI001891558F|nr:uncharacterized protein LOC119328168 [Triticum dicoccoides]
MEVTTKTIEAASTDSGWKAASSDASSTEVAAMGLNLLSGVASLPMFYYELSRHGCWPDALSRQAFLARLLVGVSWGVALQHALSRQACLRGCSPESHGMLPCSMLHRSKLASAAACQSLMGCCLAACSVVAWLPARSPESRVMLRCSMLCRSKLADMAAASGCYGSAGWCPRR